MSKGRKERERTNHTHQRLLTTRHKQSQVRQVGEKDLSDIATLMEEVDLRIGELKKSTLEFKRDVVLVDRLTAANNLGAKAGNDADSVLRCER